MNTDSKQDEALDLVDAPERVTLWICCHCQTPRQVGLTVCDHCHKRLHDTVEYTRSRASVPAVGEDAAQRRLQIALGYMKRAANRELPKLPCPMDEMTEREKAIFNVGAAAVGNLQFIARELDALPNAAASSPLPAEPPRFVSEVDQWKHDLTTAGWIAETALNWRAPDGSLWRGPAGAWKELQRRHAPAEPLQPEGEQEKRTRL